MTGQLRAPVAPLAPADIRWGADGLAPAIAQDATDGRVLMLGYMDREALAATLDTGEVHFHSRSRGRLWRKGETSGNILRLRGLSLDCDADAILLDVEPHGPTCHRGTLSCFDAADSELARAPQGFAWLETLWATIVDRAASRPAGSYTVRLLEGGVDATGRKVVEEATELLLAAKDDAAAQAAGADQSAGQASREALAGEAADLLFHALVLLAERDIPPAEVVAVLRSRHTD